MGSKHGCEHGTKVCAACKVLRKKEYTKRYRDKNRETLLVKNRESALARYYVNKDEILARSKVAYWQNPEKYRARSRRAYATLEGSVQIRKAKAAGRGAPWAEGQESLAVSWLSAETLVCSCCPRILTTSTAHIDHDHETGLLRGILCVKCNASIGHADDSPERLETQAAYLRTHKAQTQAA